MAFDYLVRLHLLKKYGGTEKTLIGCLPNVLSGVDERLLFRYTEPGLDFAGSIMQRRQLVVKGILDILDDRIIEDCLLIANLEQSFRCGYFIPTDKFLLPRLRKNLKVLAKNWFPWESRYDHQPSVPSPLYLNATFGEASMAVGGADCDWIYGHVLYDLKTTKKLGYKGDDWAQVLGYAVLSEIEQGLPYKIDMVDIEYARFNVSCHINTYQVPMIKEFRERMKALVQMSRDEQEKEKERVERMLNKIKTQVNKK